MGIIKDIHGDIEREAALLLDRYRDTLMLEALALSSGDSHAAEELVLQTFEAYLFGRERFDPSKVELLPWLRGILRNIHGKSGRGKSVKAVSYLSQDELELISEIRRQDNSTDEEILSNSDSEVIRKVIEALPDKTRRIIVLRCFESASFGEIARLLGISEISVKNRFYYARKLLARRLGKLLGRAPAIALGVILAGASLLYAAAVVTGLAPSPFAGTDPEPAVTNHEPRITSHEPTMGTDPEPAVSSLSSQAPASNHESRTTNRETNGDSPQQSEAIIDNSNTNTEGNTMNTQVVKSAAVKAMAAGAMLAATAPAVSIAADLPDGYKRIEYIQGNGTNARIVTDYIPNPQTDKVEAVVEWPSSVSDALAGNQGVWCARGNGTGSDTWTLHMLGNSGGKFRFDYKSTSGDLLEPALSADVKYTVTADRNVVSWSGGSGQTHTPVSNFIAAGNRMVLFAVYSGATIDVNRGNYGKHRLYSLKVWSSGKLIHYFVPCKDPNGVATMVDICYNAALTIDGTFTAGPEGHYYDDKLFRPAGTVYYIL